MPHAQTSARGARPAHPYNFGVLKRRVVVTGLGLITPLGLDVESTWQALIEGRSGVGLLPAVDQPELRGDRNLRNFGVVSISIPVLAAFYFVEQTDGLDRSVLPCADGEQVKGWFHLTRHGIRSRLRGEQAAIDRRADQGAPARDAQTMPAAIGEPAP